MGPSTIGARHPVAFASALALGVVLLVLGVLRADFLIDDAYISFRYARNWSEWGVPAFNPGEEPPVEGYSNPSWVWMLRVAYGMGLQIEFVARLVGAMAGVSTLVVLAFFLRARSHLGDLAIGLAILALATFPPFVLWCSGGLETALFGFLAFVTFALLTGERGGLLRGAGAGLFGVCLALTRPEGLVFALGLLGVSLLVGRPERRAAWKQVSGYLACLAVGFGLFLLWRHSVHGAWVPNTLHAKTGGLPLERGVRTVASYFLLFVTPALALLAPLVCRREERPLALGCVLILLAALAENLVVGGDWMPMFRLLAPFSPFVAIAFVLALGRVPGGVLLGVAGIVVAALPAFDRALAPRAWREALYFRTFRKGYESEWERRVSGLQNVEAFLAIGEGLRAHADPEDSITQGAIGAVGWASRLVILDRNGLVDPEIARRAPVRENATAGHDKRVPRSWFLDRDPTYFEARLVAGAIPSIEARGGKRAAREIAAFLGEEDRELLSRSLPEFHVLEGEVPRTLVLLRRVEEGAGAAFWNSLGL